MTIKLLVGGMCLLLSSSLWASCDEMAAMKNQSPLGLEHTDISKDVLIACLEMEASYKNVANLVKSEDLAQEPHKTLVHCVEQKDKAGQCLPK